MVAALELRSLAKSYQAGLPGCVASARVLECVELRLEVGEVLGIVGDAGAGKTTLLLCAAGLLRPDRGQVRWFGGEAGRASDVVSSPVVLVGSARPGLPMRAVRESPRPLRWSDVPRRADPAPPPRVVLADDPPLLRGARPGSGFVRLLADYAAAGGAVLLASRDHAALAAVATRIVVLRDGRLATSPGRRLCRTVAER